MESLDSRASALNRYHYLAGETDYLATDLARYTNATLADVQTAAQALTPDRVCIARVRPEESDSTTQGAE